MSAPASFETFVHGMWKENDSCGEGREEEEVGREVENVTEAVDLYPEGIVRKENGV